MMMMMNCHVYNGLLVMIMMMMLMLQIQKAAGWGLIVTSQWKREEIKRERKPGEISVCD